MKPLVCWLALGLMFGGCRKQPEHHRLLWTFKTGNVVPTCPAVAKDGSIYLGSHDHFFYCLHSEGQEKWRFETGDYVHGSPTLDAEGNVYFGSFDGFVYAFTSAGQVAWKFKTKKFVFALPLLCGDGRLLFGSDDGIFYALQSDSPGPASSAWPMFQREATHAGGNTKTTNQE